MEKKWLQGILITGLSLTSLVFLVIGNTDLAIVFMTLLFVCTNAFRYIRMKEQGMLREAKWMLGMAVIFAVLFVGVLVMTVL